MIKTCIDSKKIVEWTCDDGILSRGRNKLQLIVLNDGSVHKFNSFSEDGVVHVLGTDYEKNGKWSKTTYRCVSPAGSVILHLTQDFENGRYFNEDFLIDAYSSLQKKAPMIRLDSFADFIKQYLPKTWERWESNSAIIERMEEESEAASPEVVVIGFGYPTNREMKEGFWSSDKEDSDGKVRISPHPEKGWGEPVVIHPKGAKVIASYYTSGMHGGYYQIRVLVDGSELSDLEEDSKDSLPLNPLLTEEFLIKFRNGKQ